MWFGIQTIYLGQSEQGVRRVVRSPRDRAELGIQTGYIELRHESVHVWRPSNPKGLGLARAWADGRWRNMYEIANVPAPPESDEVHGLVEIDMGGVAASLPGAKLYPTRDLERFLKQHLR